MPRKKKTSAEAEAAEGAAQPETTAAKAAVTEPGDDVPKARRKAAAKTAAKTVAKSAPKKRAGKTATIRIEEEPDPRLEAALAAATETPQSAETIAHAADTFEDAFEANDLGETRAATATAEAAEPAARAEAGSEAEKAPEGWADEGGEIAGDWESGSGDESAEERPQPPPGKQERLQKILAAAGVASRRHAEQLIVEGRVQVNGQVVTTLGSKADAGRDHIRVDGKLLHGAERLRYFMLNKPRGHVTTVSDPEGRPTVMQFFERMGERLYPVGRLDYQSEGLLLMTNDGELANQLTRAASGVEKVYLVKVSGQPDEAQIEALRSGVRIERGRPGEGRVETAPARIRQFRQGDNPWFEVGLIEGRNRELRKMFEEIGHHVEKIRRVGYGPLELDVEPGKMRELTAEEVQLLRLAAEGKLKPKRIRTANKLPREAGRTVDRDAVKGRGERPAGGQERRRDAGGPKRDFSGVRREGVRPQGRVEPKQGRGGGAGFARGDRGGFRPREERPGQGQDRGQGRTQDRGQGRVLDRGKSWGPGRGREESQGLRPQLGPRPEQGEREKGGRGERSGQRSQFGQRPALGGKPPQRFERAGSEGRTFERGANRGVGRSSRPPGQRPFPGKPESGVERPRTERPRFERPRVARPPRAEGFEDRGTRPPRVGGGGKGRKVFDRGPARSFERPSRPPRGGEDRGTRGRSSGVGERPSAPSRSGGFAGRGSGSGARPGGNPRFGSRPGSGGSPRTGGGGPPRPGSGGSSRSGGARHGQGKPHGSGGRKPGGFGKRGPR